MLPGLGSGVQYFPINQHCFSSLKADVFLKKKKKKSPQEGYITSQSVLIYNMIMLDPDTANFAILNFLIL